MKRLFHHFALLATVALGAVACTESDINENIDIDINESESAFTLYAEAEAVGTKANFEYDKNTNIIAFDWDDQGDDADQITLYHYNTGERVGNFRCNDAELKSFKAVDDVTLIEGDFYNAIFPATDAATLSEAKSADYTSLQNGDEISTLNNACFMVGSFIYKEGEKSELTMRHQLAVATFEMGDKKPIKLVFQDDKRIYTVNYTDAVEPYDGTNYRSHIMIKQSGYSYTRDLTFTFTYEGGATRYTVQTSKGYNSGYNYYFPFEDIPNKENMYWLGEGEGTEASPYLINDADDLRMLATSVNNCESLDGNIFKLTQDIDLKGEEFTTIGSGGAYFSEVFDGNGKSITGLKINQPNSDRQALFGYTNNAVIKNLTVSGEVAGNSYVGGIAGSVNKSTIINCHSNVKVSGKAKRARVGGIAGAISNFSKVVNCYNSAEVSGTDTDAHVGGIVGDNLSSSLVTNCYNSAAVKCPSSYNYAGGVVGSSESYVTYSCCKDTDGDNILAIGNGGDNSLNCNKRTENQLQSSSFADELNTTAFEYNDGAPEIKACAWKYNANGYPSLDFGMSPIPADYSGCWTDEGNYSTDDFEGSGTVDDPYLIRKASQLAKLARDVNELQIVYSKKYIRLECDISLKGRKWNPIGTSVSVNRTFMGYFDGGNHTISGLYVNDIDSDSKQYGLFGEIWKASIKNLSVSGCVKNNSGGCSVGGIVGRSAEAIVDNCHNRATVIANGDSSEIGGVVGSNYYSKVINCSNDAEVYSTATVTYHSYVNRIGGVVGMSKSDTSDYYYCSSIVTNCHNNGKVSASSKYHYIGGIVGYNIVKSSIVNCYNSAEVSGVGSSKIGGIVGNMGGINTLLTSCYNSANIICTGANEEVGGVAGYITNGATVNYSYYDTDVYPGGRNIGKEYNMGDSFAPIVVTDCYGYDTQKMQSQAIVNVLNSGSNAYNTANSSEPQACGWKCISGGYPALDL